MEKGESAVRITRLSYYKHIFGDLSKVVGSDMDPKALAKGLMASGGVRPAIYMACGTEDFGVKSNENYSQYLDSIGYDHEFHTSTGIHNWTFWEEYIQKAMNWLDTLKA
jgi:putative tributyrin esterase